ncbi:MAG: hypothetical protein RL722_2006 [Pseudomonadota bacterium]|jgi:signal transduction histidine kinase
MTLDPPLELHQPLPGELAGRGQGWFTTYRRYPVYSRPWARGRLRLIGLVLGLFFGFIGLALWRVDAQDRPYGVVLQLAIMLALPALIGPWAATWVRERHWPEAREWRALQAVMLLCLGGVLGFVHWGAEPLKQWVAEQTGNLNPDGSRRRVALSVGVNLVTPEELAAARSTGQAPRAAADLARQTAGSVEQAPGSATPQPAPTGLESLPSFELLVYAAAVWLLAGGAGLAGWKRERAGLRRLARERELAQAQARRREAELQLSVLAAQVEPHFLFNTLAGVRSAIVGDPARATEMVDRLVDYLRASIPRLRSDGSAQATVAGQLDIVRAYLGLMVARMPRLSVTVDAQPGLLERPCPPWMLISLVENAVKHGVEPKLGPAHIAVQARAGADGGLVLEVLDDGVGFAASPASDRAGSGLGLVNIRERLAQLHGGRAALRLTARPGGGVCAAIELPPEPAGSDRPASS